MLDVPRADGGAALRVSASIGAVLSLGWTEVGDLVGVADEAMYRVKRGGKCGWELVGGVEASSGR